MQASSSSALFGCCSAEQAIDFKMYQNWTQEHRSQRSKTVFTQSERERRCLDFYWSRSFGLHLQLHCNTYWVTAYLTCKCKNVWVKHQMSEKDETSISLTQVDPVRLQLPKRNRCYRQLYETALVQEFMRNCVSLLLREAPFCNVLILYALAHPPPNVL